MISRVAFEDFLQQQGLAVVAEHEHCQLWHSERLAERLETSIALNTSLPIVPVSFVRITLRKLGLTWDDFVKAVPTAA